MTPTQDRPTAARRKRQRDRADGSFYSRHHLGDGIYGQEYDDRCAMMRAGNRAMLQAYWKNHQRVMLVAEALGRQVARP